MEQNSKHMSYRMDANIKQTNPVGDFCDGLAQAVFRLDNSETKY